MGVEEHVLDEVGRQLDYYVDAYRKVHDIDIRLASLSEKMAELTAERLDAERLRDAAIDNVNDLLGSIPEDDEQAVGRFIEERLAPLVGLMVL